MLDHLGESEASSSIVSSIETVLENKKNRTPDLGGTSNTQNCTSSIISELYRHCN